MDRLVAQANTLNDVPHSSRFSVTGNGNPFPNTYDSGPHPNDYQLGGMSTVAGEYGAPGNDEEDLFQYINYEPDGQAVDIIQENGRNATPQSAVVQKGGLHIVTTEALPKLLISTGSQLLSPKSANNPSPASAHKDDNSHANVTESTQDRNTYLPSPTVKIDDYNWAEMPLAREPGRISGGLEHTGVCSPSHLSLPLQDTWTGDDTVDGIHYQNQPSSWQLPTVQRNRDGSWSPSSANGPSGIDPKRRTHTANCAVPTLAEQEQLRKLAAKNAKVADWVSHSQTGANAGINAGDRLFSAGRIAPSGSPRAISPGQVTVRQRAAADSVGPRSLGIDVSVVPGSSVVVDEASEDEEDSDRSSYDEEAMISATIAALKSYSINENIKAEMPPAQDDGNAEPPLNTRFWGDPPRQPTISEFRFQPDSSTAAMTRFYERNKEIEAASRTATIASSQRRLSEADLNIIYKGATKPRRFSRGKDKDKTAQKTGRRPSLFDNLLRRSSSNVLKRKVSHPAQASHEVRTTETTSQYSQNKFSDVRLVPPSLDTNTAAAPRERGSVSPISGLAHTKPLAHLTNAIRRSRSKGDMPKPMGLAAMMTQHGGPPVPALATRPVTADQGVYLQAYWLSDQDIQNAGDAKDESVAEQSMKKDPMTPVKPTAASLDAFRLHIRQYGPQLSTSLVERIATEQMARYTRLADLNAKHSAAVSLGDCSNLCTSLGGSPRILPMPSSKKGSESKPVGYRVQSSVISGKNFDSPDGATLEPARFPTGIPPPPVTQLPAQFECNICFKIKTIMKPSDWTKHVLEDVQPFICGFSPCGDPKSFKRKADWRRHEEESHRHLESWVCSMEGCEDVRYRKDNFIQHLVRTHKESLPEDSFGKLSATASNDEADSDNNQHKSGSSSSPEVTADATQRSVKDIATFLRTCHRKSSQSPQDEPCRFCGEVLGSWKMLNLHHAEHMEQISLSVLHLINDNHVYAKDDHVPDEDILSTGGEEQEEIKQNMQMLESNIPVATPSPQRITQIPEAGPSWHTPVDSGYDNLLSVYISSGAAPTMHSYPRPQMASYDMPAPGQYYMIKPKISPTPGNGQGVASPIPEWSMAPSLSEEASGLQPYPIAPSGQSYPNPQIGQNDSRSPNSQSYPPAVINHMGYRVNNNQGWAPFQQATQFGPSPLTVAPATGFAEPDVYSSPTDTIFQSHGLDLGYLVPDGGLSYLEQQNFGQYAQVQQNQTAVYSHFAQSYSYPPQ